jgi:uncharacterized protein YdhG (YjbR/CyaY superfamily)
MKMSKNPKFSTADAYFKSQTPETQNNLLALRALIFKAAPHAVELINYDIPAYALVEGGKRDKQIMVAGYKTFVGFYTGTGILAHFSTELTAFKVGKASVQFPNNTPLPEDLIIRMVQFKIKSVTQ